MGAAFTAEIRGLKQVTRRLRKLPGKLQRRVLRSAVQKSGTIIKKAAKKLVPVGEGTTSDGRPREHLKNTIERTRAKWYPKTGTMLVVVGPEKNKGFHAHLVHDGTKPHQIVLTKPLVLNNVVLPPGFAINHPGAKAQPFVDRAVRATRGTVIKKLSDSIAKGIEKETNKLRGKT